MTRHTHTEVVLPVQPGTYQEIKRKLESNGYNRVVKDTMLEPHERVSMTGIAIAPMEVGNNPATALRDYIVDSGFPLTDEAEEWFRKMALYCDQIVGGDIKKGEQPDAPPPHRD